MASKTIKLTEPIKLGDRTIAEVTVRSPKVKEVRALDALARSKKPELDVAVEAVTILTDLSAEMAEELDTADLGTITEAVSGFFPKAPGGAAGAE